MDAEAQRRTDAIDRLIDAQPLKSFGGFRGDGAALSATLFEKAGIPNDLKFTSQDFFSPGPYGADINKTLTDELKGAEFVDGAFVSTSKSQAIALDKFVPGSSTMSRYGASGLVEITGKTKALDVDAVTGMRASEQERLLPRGTKFRVKDVQVKAHPDGKRIYLHWRVEIV